jgi:hypothetical protein
MQGEPIGLFVEKLPQCVFTPPDIDIYFIFEALNDGKQEVYRH